MISFIATRILFRNRAAAALTGAVALMGVLYGWHRLDKSSAVREAVVGYVAGAELAAAQAEANELRRAAAAARAAQEQLAEKVQVAEGAALAAQQEIERYAEQTQQNPSGVVDGHLFGRLRGR